MVRYIPGLRPVEDVYLIMTTYEKRVLLFLNATQDLPVDIQQNILKYYPPPKMSPRMQGFLARWKARPSNV